MSDKVCQVCGNTSGKYILCASCNEKKEKGLVVKDDSGKFVLVEVEEAKKCIICGEEAKYDLCLSCYKTKEFFYREIDGSTNTVDDTRDYYNHLKYNIYKLNNMDYARKACLKLISLGEILQTSFKLEGFSDKAKKDSVDLLQKKKEYLESLASKKSEEEDHIVETTATDGNIIQEEYEDKQEILDYRRLYPMNFRCNDGHYVRSKAEKMIDDYLFDKRITHVYEKKVINEDNDEEYYPDFYLIIPVKNMEVGIYLEFFGLEDDEKYMATEKKKLDYYAKKEFNVIEVRDKNTTNLTDYLDSEILKIKKKYR